MSSKNHGSALLSEIRSDFIGLDTVYELADGRKARRVYLDSTASTLMMGAAHDAIEAFYDHYANTHSLLHFSAKISTRGYQWAHKKILSFLGADEGIYACFLTGSGTTAVINRIARVFRDFRPDRTLALVSLMEHHSNDLPHRKHAQEVIHIPLNEHESGQPGCIDLTALEKELKKNRARINYVAVTVVSNVTGIINPIHDIAELTHTYGGLILVDGAQAVAHLPIQLGGQNDPNRNIDAFIFSGHKTYVPGSPGVVVCRKDILESMEPEEVGGGMVKHVYVDRYVVSDRFPDREEAGTPNIPGAIGLATALEVLDRIGMETIFAEETEFIQMAMERIKIIPDVVIYGEGDSDICPRAGAISFNIRNIDHGLVAAILNDYHNIAVRNECFCAHPYVKEMVIGDLLNATEYVDEEHFEEAFHLKSGMVRASFGLYNQREDVDALVEALEDIVKNKDNYQALYTVDAQTNYVHRTFRPDIESRFSIPTFVDRYLNDQLSSYTQGNSPADPVRKKERK